MRRLEDKLQINCTKWLRLQHPSVLFNHSPNGGYRTKAEGGIFKAMGVLAGYPDLEILRASNGFHALFIEFKSPTGRLSESQKEFWKRAVAEGYAYMVIRSFDEFMKTVNEYLR